MKQDLEFFKGKKTFITGHTGFKGSWMVQALLMAGADITGYALDAPTKPSLFELGKYERQINSIHGDIRDLERLKKAFAKARPEIVLHMAAQPLVRESYKNPVGTYDTNVMGTVHILECVRINDCVKSFLNVTTDKVYLNREWEWGYRENDELNGYDPYSNSKSCSELVTGSYCNSFFRDREIAASTARAGNVIGGGDFAADRIIPDCIRAAQKKEDIIVRNPFSIRPYQHVLEPVMAYLRIVKEQCLNRELAGNYNVGPQDESCVATGELVRLFCDAWNQKTGGAIGWVNRHDGGPHEAGFLRLDCSKMQKTFNWKPRWDVKEAVEKTIDWTEDFLLGKNVRVSMENQILEYLDLPQNQRERRESEAINRRI